MKVLVTGSEGFIGGYIVDKLLKEGHQVRGLDNYSKYGKVVRSFHDNYNYTFVEGDAKDYNKVVEILEGCDHFIANAALIGGISMFHEFAYDLLEENERILAAGFRAAINEHLHGKLKKITVMSSSMVFESTATYPTPEGEQFKCPPPLSTYGFQKLATEYWAKGAWEQHKLPYTIIRPFNCIGIGETRAVCDKDIMSGNIKLAMSHVVPDLIQKIVKGQDPLHILGNGEQIRHYTHGKDIARGIYMSLENENAINNDFNISNDVSTTVLELSKMIWEKIKGDKPFSYIPDDPFKYDVQKRIPNVNKAKELLGFEAEVSLNDALDEVIPWVKEEIEKGVL